MKATLTIFGMLGLMAFGLSIAFLNPYWFLALLAVLAPIIGFITWRWRRKLAMVGKCSNCGYDLTANETGRCPECGAATASMKVEG